MEQIETKINKALDLINCENFEEAKILFEQILKIDNNNIEAYKNLGLCEVNLDNPIGAIEAFLNVKEINPDDATAMFYLANCYSRIGEKEKAIVEFNNVLKLRPDCLDAYKSLAMIYIEFSQVDNAIKAIEPVLNNPNIEPDYSTYYILATSYMLKKDNINAIKYLESAIELNDTNISLFNSLAVCYLNVKNYENAYKALEIAKLKNDKFPLTYYNLGVLFQTQEQYKVALDYFKKSYEIEPTVTMLSTLANCALKAQEYNLACALYRNLVDVFPNNEKYRISYIEILDTLSRYDEALVQTNKLLEIDAKNTILIKKKGTYLRKLGLLNEAISMFESLVKRGKIDVEVYYNMAFCYVEMLDYDNAKEMFKKCITLEPNNPYAHKDLGILYLKMNCYEWALDEINEAIRLEDDVAEFYYSLGVVYMMLSRINDAKEALEKSIKLDDKNPDCYAYYGYIFMLDGDFDNAKIYINKALEIDSNNFLAKMHLAKLYYKMENYSVAKELLLDIANSSKDDETMNMLGICYMKLEQYSEASGIFLKLMVKYPKNHILLTDLAKCEIKIQRIKEANEHIRQALMIFEDYKPALDLLEEIKNNG